MIETLHELLVNSEARDAQAVQAKLEENASAGAAWFD